MGFADRTAPTCSRQRSSLTALPPAVDAVKDGGGFASVRGWRGNGERGITFHRTSVRDYDHRPDLIDRLRQQAEDDVLTPRVSETFGRSGLVTLTAASRRAGREVGA